MHNTPNLYHHTHDPLQIAGNGGFQPYLSCHSIITLRVVWRRSDNAAESVILQMTQHLLRVASANLPCNPSLCLASPGELSGERVQGRGVNGRDAILTYQCVHGGHAGLNQKMGRDFNPRDFDVPKNP
jgi:hypothetical protein